MIKEVHYKELKVTGTFYNNVSAYMLLEHLKTNCGRLHTSDLINLPTQMIGYYADTAGILEYIDQLEEARKKLAQVNLPMTDQQPVAIALVSILALQHFLCTTEDWERLPDTSKT
jgi:hypothetical protein